MLAVSAARFFGRHVARHESVDGIKDHSLGVCDLKIHPVEP